MGLRAVSVLLAALGVACASAAGLGPFETTGQADDARVGTIRARASGAPIDAAALERRLRDARFVLLGEVHDNPDHHRLQARWLAALADASPLPGLVVEMIAPDRQPAIDAFRAEGGRDPDAFAERVAWAASGWPAFALYRPIFAVALDRGLAITAAELPRMASLAPDAPERSAGFGLEAPLPLDEQAERIEEMFEGHCELMPREHLAPMVEMQRARDARLALALLRAEARAGRAVLVAGNGHVRDRDVPALLVRAGVPRAAIATVGLIEVAPEGDERDEDAAGGFDFAVFTPAAERPDPCEPLRKRLGSG